MNIPKELCFACEDGDLERVKSLEEHNYVSSITYTAGLRIACERGHAHIVKFLLTKPYVKVNAHNSQEHSLLDLAVKNFQYETVQVLVQSPKVKVSAVALYLTCKMGDSEMLKILLSGKMNWSKDLILNRTYIINESPALVGMIDEYLANRGFQKN